jgi:hypothetical protein
MRVKQYLDGARFNVPRPLDWDQSLIQQSLKKCAVSKDTEHTFPLFLAGLNLLCRDRVTALLKAIQWKHELLIRIFKVGQVISHIDLHQYARKTFQHTDHFLKEILRERTARYVFCNAEW